MNIYLRGWFVLGLGFDVPWRDGVCSSTLYKDKEGKMLKMARKDGRCEKQSRVGEENVLVSRSADGSLGDDIDLVVLVAGQQILLLILECLLQAGNLKGRVLSERKIGNIEKKYHWG